MPKQPQSKGMPKYVGIPQEQQQAEKKGMPKYQGIPEAQQQVQHHGKHGMPKYATATEYYENQGSNLENTVSNGRATTTRYWDCSGGSCGCGYGDPNHPAMCNSNALFAAPGGNEYGATFYGTAALS